MLTIPIAILIAAMVLLAVDVVITHGQSVRSRWWWVSFLIVLALLWPTIWSR